ncbi:E3 ubiquitin/ISG15 ligase TRIM25-like [Mixophyes fleayi]|uniref:E3 ubiquitin/ISG15 ligase TRIM25-like n=1 Tax=Mixophyes fleayi TaxID=3061075 RepID=UPI003F4E0267
MASADLRDDLSCSICMNIYTNPITLSCGHNFCMDCIKRTWDHQDQGESTCPECRQRFRNRPELKRNLRLCNIVSRYQTAQPDRAEMVCTYCAHSAVRTCLQCAVFLCNNHLRVHSISANHDLTQSTASMKNKKCHIHNELFRYYCTEDAVCICTSCSVVGEHRGHQVESLDDASEKTKRKLMNVMKKMNLKRKEYEKNMQNLKVSKREMDVRVTSFTERVTALFKDIREHLETLENRVLVEISRQEEFISLQLTSLIQKLEMQSDELLGKIIHFEELCNSADPLTVLRGDLEGFDFWDPEEQPGKDTKTVANLDKILIDLTLHTGFTDILTKVKKDKGFYVQEASDVLLDIETAGNNVVVTGNLKSASWSLIDHHNLKTRKSFEVCQVLSNRTFFSGQHYWEVETSGLGVCSVGVAYGSIDRKGQSCNVGYNNKSWCLQMSDNKHFAVHNSTDTLLHDSSSCRRLGIFLDYEAGRLSFYQLCDPIKHLHTFTATFSEPLHAAFYVFNSCVQIKS